MKENCSKTNQNLWEPLLGGIVAHSKTICINPSKVSKHVRKKRLIQLKKLSILQTVFSKLRNVTSFQHSSTRLLLVMCLQRYTLMVHSTSKAWKFNVVACKTPHLYILIVSNMNIWCRLWHFQTINFQDWIWIGNNLGYFVL